jgi:exodeoxyribonuclease VII large subunit
MGVDVMIVGRGGGSIEDLWAFNERAVAQAVFDCSIPIISAVGHETDTTIIDYVSDLRAPTPSAAAELAVADVREILGNLASYQDVLVKKIRHRVQRERDAVRHMERQLQLLSPASRIRENRSRSLSLEERLQSRMQTLLQDKRHELKLYIQKMKGLSPLEKLNSGYSYVENEAGQNIRSVGQVEPGQLIKVTVTDGTIEAKILNVREDARA